MHSLQLQRRPNGDVMLNLHCRIDENGDFRIEGHDLSPTSEYEWCTIVAKDNLPELCTLLGAVSLDDLFDVIARDYLPVEGDGLEQLIRDSDVPSRFSNYSRFD